MNNKQEDFECKECGMRFTNPVRLKRHFKVAHKSKHDGFISKWYWEKEEVKDNER